MSKETDASWQVTGKKVRVSGEDGFLWEAFDRSGEVLEFFMTKTEDEAAARQFFEKMLGRP